MRREKQASPLTVFFRQFKSPLIYILIIAAAISIGVGQYIDAAVIFLIVC